MAKRKRKRSNNRFKILIGLAIGTMIFTILISSCLYLFGIFIWANPYVNCFGSPFPTQANVEADAYFNLPPSATQFEYDSHIKNRGCTAWVSFAITPDDVTPFLDSAPVSALESKQLDDRIFLLRMKEKEWSQPKQSIAGHRYLNDYEVDIWVDQWIYIDITDPELYKVYIIVDKDWI